MGRHSRWPHRRSQPAGAVQRARMVQRRRRLLAQEPAEAERVADALRGDRVLKWPASPGRAHPGPHRA